MNISIFYSWSHLWYKSHLPLAIDFINYLHAFGKNLACLTNFFLPLNAPENRFN